MSIYRMVPPSYKLVEITPLTIVISAINHSEMGVMFTNLSNYGAPLCNYVNLCHYVNISWCGDLFQCARYIQILDRWWPGICSPCAIPPLRARRTLPLGLLGSRGCKAASICFPSSPAVPEFRSCSKDGCIEICLFQQRQEAANWKLCFLMWWFWWWFLNGEEHSIYRNSLFFRESGVQQEAAR